MISSISSVNNRLQYSARSAHHHVEVDGVLRAVLIVPMPSTFVRDSTVRHGAQTRTNMGVSGTLESREDFRPVCQRSPPAPWAAPSDQYPPKCGENS